MEYTVIIEKAGDGGFSVYVPDLPGRVSCGDTMEEVRASIREAIRLHIESLREHREPVPPPRSQAAVIEAAKATVSDAMPFSVVSRTKPVSKRVMDGDPIMGVTEVEKLFADLIRWLAPTTSVS